jgi:hypothetical protein
VLPALTVLPWLPNMVAPKPVQEHSIKNRDGIEYASIYHHAKFEVEQKPERPEQKQSIST